jgi:hypothetical protein
MAVFRPLPLTLVCFAAQARKGRGRRVTGFRLGRFARVGDDSARSKGAVAWGEMQ